MNATVQFASAARRFLNPVRNVRWTTSHISQPAKPLTAGGRRRRRRGTVRSSPSCRGRVAERLGLASAQTAHDGLRGVAAALNRHLGHAGQAVRPIRSPTTKISGCPGSEQSGSTTRPARSTLAPVAIADHAGPSGDACTPAAQIFVRASMRRRCPCRQRCRGRHHRRLRPGFRGGSRLRAVRGALGSALQAFGNGGRTLWPHRAAPTRAPLASKRRKFSPQRAA